MSLYLFAAHSGLHAGMNAAEDDFEPALLYYWLMDNRTCLQFQCGFAWLRRLQVAVKYTTVSNPSSCPSSSPTIINDIESPKCHGQASPVSLHGRALVTCEYERSALVSQPYHGFCCAVHGYVVVTLACDTSTGPQGLNTRLNVYSKEWDHLERPSPWSCQSLQNRSDNTSGELDKKIWQLAHMWKPSPSEERSIHGWL